MKFQVIRTRRKGRLIMMFARNENGVFEGDLVIEEKLLDDLHRSSLVASLRDESGKDVKGLDRLCDIRLTGARKGYWTMTGFERDGLPGCSMVDYCQSWIMSPLDEAYRALQGPSLLTDDEVAAKQAGDVARAAAEKEVRERAKIQAKWPPKIG